MAPRIGAARNDAVHFGAWADRAGLGRRGRLSRLRHSGEPETTSGNCLQVLVRDNNVDQALRVLKKRLQREGVFREMKLRKYFEKPSEKRVRQAAEAVRRSRKQARKTAIREGLIAAPVRKAPEARGGRPAGGGGGSRF